MAAVVAVFGAHLAVWWARFDGFDGTVLAVDALLAVAALVAVATHIEALARERRRAAMLRLMASTYAVPRGINEAARAGVELLVAAGFADAGVAAVVRTEPDERVDSSRVDALGDVALLSPVGTAGFPPSLEEPSMDVLPVSAVHEFGISREATEVDRWLAPLGEALGPRPWVARIPLHNGEETLGALLLVAERRGALHDEGLLQLIASLIGGALDYARLYQAAYDQARELEAQDGRRREFLYAISHELRTPLTSIRAFAELLSEQRPARGRRRPSDDELLQSLARGVDRLSELVEDLLGLGRLEEVRESLDVGPVELRVVLQDVETVLRPVFAQSDQELRLELPDEDVWVRGERRTLEHVLMNLMSNANRHTPAGGAVEVRVTGEASSAVRVEVHDTGPGIEPADRELIFQPFYRVRRPGVAQVPGAGLGLAIARRSAERLRGRLWVDAETSAGESGARFCLEVPALPPSEIPTPTEASPSASDEPDPQLRMDLVEGRGVER